MKHPLSFLGGCVAGAVAMYYLDQASGSRRRARVRDQRVAAGHAAGVQELENRVRLRASLPGLPEAVAKAGELEPWH